MQKCGLVKINSGLGGGAKGASLSAHSLEIAALNENKNFFSKAHSFDCIQDYSTETEVPYLKNVKRLLPFYKTISKTLPAILKKNTHTIIVSGDHSNAIASIASLQKAYPTKTIGIVWIDAHLDLHNPYTTPSGNMHGMSLGVFFNQQKKNRKLSTNTLKYWKEILSLSGKVKKIENKHLAFLGVRSLEEEENNILNEFNVTDIMIENLRSNSINNVTDQLKKQFVDCDLVYLSFDVDVLDPNISIGTGTPVPMGLGLHETKKLLETIVQKLPVKIFEITEINPLLDTENKMAKSVLPIFESIFKKFN